jgi:tripartite-type tricarboxylate transporter receptor subunit TctC
MVDHVFVVAELTGHVIDMKVAPNVSIASSVFRSISGSAGFARRLDFVADRDGLLQAGECDGQGRQEQVGSGRGSMYTDRRRLVTVALALGAASVTPAPGQDAYPKQPVRVIVPYRLNGATGVFARLVTEVMSRLLSQPFVPEDLSANGAINAAEAAAHAAPDGYTVLLGDVSTYAINKSLYRNLPYDPQKDFAPITLTGRFAVVLLVNTNKLRVKSLTELIEIARRAPGTIAYATPGIGSPSHLTTELLADTADIKVKHVPYPNAKLALEGLASGQVGMMFIDLVDARSLQTTPGIRALAVASPEEHPALPGVPTVAAAGFPGFEAWVWQGLAVPAGTDADVIEKLHATYVQVIMGPQIVRRLAAAGFDVMQSTPAQFTNYMRSETEKWDKVIRTANIRADY